MMGAIVGKATNRCGARLGQADGPDTHDVVIHIIDLHTPLCQGLDSYADVQPGLPRSGVEIQLRRLSSFYCCCHAAAFRPASWI